MKTKILIGLSMALFAVCANLRADDTPAQAAARAALDQEFYQLDHASAQSSPLTNAVADHKAPIESVINTTGAPGVDASIARTTPAAIADTRVSVAPSGVNHFEKVPADNTAAQTKALAALRQRMKALNNATNQLSLAAKSIEGTVTTPEIIPAFGTSVAATPITETPTAEAPVARIPAITTATTSPVSVVPAVTTPTPEVPGVPVANTLSDAVPGAVGQRTMTPIMAPATTIGLPKSSPGHARPTNELVTTSGKIYRNVEVERVALDGVFISYTPSQGGWAMTKVPFEDLPAEIRQQYEK